MSRKKTGKAAAIHRVAAAGDEIAIERQRNGYRLRSLRAGVVDVEARSLGELLGAVANSIAVKSERAHRLASCAHTLQQLDAAGDELVEPGDVAELTRQVRSLTWETRQTSAALAELIALGAFVDD